MPFRAFLCLLLPVILMADTEFHVNHCVLRCKDNHMREMDNEWSHDFTLPLLNLLKTTGNETAAFIKAKAICTSNGLLEMCVNNCNTSQEVSIILAGIRSWHDACNNLEEVRAQFPCWKENGERLSSVCRDQTVRLETDMLKFAKNQTQENIDTICMDFEHFSHCFIQEHGKYCGYRSEVITARMFENNREAMFKMLKIRWNTLPASCKYTQLRRDTYSSDRVSARYPIETWSRPQLEDHFHNVVEELQNAQKKVKEQEKQITTFNSRFRRNLLERKSRVEKVVERSKYDDVVKENQILDMKLKAAKQQLLIYTAPSARAATASMMTGRSTFRQPPSTWRQRPPLTAGTGSIDRPPTAPIIRKKSSEGEKLQLATDEKLTIVRLNRTLKNKNDEIAELKYTIEKLKQLRSTDSAPPSRGSTSSSKRSSNNNNDDDEEGEELSEMSEMSDSARSATPVIEEKKPSKGSNGNKQQLSVSAQRIADQNEKVLMDKLRVAENDLQMLREECELVKKANERLVQQSLSKSTEYGARESIEEKKKNVALEEQLKETERRIKESEHRRREDQKKFEAMRVHYKEKYEAAKAERKQTSAPVTAKAEEDKRSDSPPPMIYEPIRKRPSQGEISRMRRADDDLLQKLYKEVADILQSHDVGIADMTSLGAGAGDNSLGRWQKLYAELYEELEKIRNMLVVQYDINQKQSNEIRILKDELERMKQLSAEMLSKAKEEIEEKQKKIFQLEEQIRTIAYSGQQPVKLLSNQLNLPTLSINTDLSVKLIHVKPAASLISKFFFSLEFFDFQLETTPIMEPKQQKMDFTTVYDVLVSNLLIHYLQTNGITIEMYRPASDSFKLLAAATISLIPLFEENVIQKFCSEIILKSVETGVEMCTLRYEIDISQPISDSFTKFKRSETARNMMPLKLETEQKEEDSFEPLTIMVNRVVGLETLAKDSAEFCVVYEFLSFSPYFTDFSSSPEVRSKRDCHIPKTDSARSLFTSSNISFFLIENIPKQDGVIATLHLPLHPLCKLGGSIKGVFPMLDVNGRASSVSLDICLLWKHEIPSFFVKPEREPEASQPVVAPPRRTSKQFDVTPVKENEPIIREELPGSPAVAPPTSEPTPILPISSILPRTFSDSSSESSFSANSKGLFSPPARNKPAAFDYHLPVAPDGDIQDGVVYDNDEEVESVSAKSSHREPEPMFDYAPPKPLPSLRVAPAIPVLALEETEQKEEESKEDSPISVKSASPTESQGEETPRPAVEEEGSVKTRESTPPTQRSLDEAVEEEGIDKEGDKKKELQTEELKSLLGVLPPIAKPRNIPVGPISLTEPPKKPPAKAQSTTGRIEFTNPLHHSIPASESSNTSTPRRAEKPPVPLLEYEGQSLIKVQKPESPVDKDVVEPEMKVVIELEAFELVPRSSLTPWTREDTQFYVDWCFLDFDNEQSKSSVFDFPRRPQDNVDISFSKEYVLTRGQVSLLNQWIQASVKFELTVIKISPGEEEELGFGSIILVPNNTQNKSIVIEIFDRNGIVQAELQLTIQFSRALLEQLN
ncbi:unnamed protein product [Caenorhabditis sp. 36 PRJEB53466]|nr:unnamed protein product [Caenorhabditis sp. 36 PRJEB53466]